MPDPEKVNSLRRDSIFYFNYSCAISFNSLLYYFLVTHMTYLTHPFSRYEINVNLNRTYQLSRV